MAEDAQTLNGRPPADFDQSSHAAETGNPHGTSAADVGAPTESEVDDRISTHEAGADAHHVRYADGEAVSAVLAADGPESGLNADLLDDNEAAYFATASELGTLQAQVDALQDRVDDLESLLANVTRSDDDLYFDGMNVHIRNDGGATATANALGNLIVGYNEDTSNNDRTGSHNLVVGVDHEYTSYGGLLGGSRNTVSGPWASASGGYANTADGDYSSVTGGQYNTANGNYSSVTGGAINTAGNTDSSVSGGQYNRASGSASSVSGGYRNTASGFYSSTNGGEENAATGHYSSVSGGKENIASGSHSFVGGGGSASAGGNEALGN